MSSAALCIIQDHLLLAEVQRPCASHDQPEHTADADSKGRGGSAKQLCLAYTNEYMDTGHCQLIRGNYSNWEKLFFIFYLFYFFSPA